MRNDSKAFPNIKGVESIKTLYVVLHGLISVVDDGGDQLIAYLLDMQDAHECLFGTWLDEQEIPSRPPNSVTPQATLVNVDRGNATLDPDKNAVVKIKSTPAFTDSRVRAVINLPRPNQIHSLLPTPLTPGQLTLNGNIASLVQFPTEICEIKVFEYTFPDVRRVSVDFGTVAWQCPSLAHVKNLAVAVLHVYNEPASPLPDGSDHNEQEFIFSANFLGTQLTLTGSGDPVEDPTLPPGLLGAELTPLAVRKDTLLRLGFALRTKQPIEDVIGLGTNGSGLCVPPNARVVSPGQ